MDFVNIKKQGEEFLRQLNKKFHLNLGYNKQSVEYLDWYISQNRDIFSEEERENLRFSIGYILGEAIIKAYGGEWQYDEDFREWIVNIGKAQANPIGKTQKYLESYLDSIESFYQITGMYKKNNDSFDFKKDD